MKKTSEERNVRSMHQEANGQASMHEAEEALVPGLNDLGTLYPALAEEWDHERNGNGGPDQVSLHSAMNAWWKCSKCGNRWRATVANRVRGTECPYCKQL